MNKILIIIQREFMTRIRKKSFILLTLLIPFIFAALIFVPIWLASIKSDTQGVVKVVDNTGRYVAALKNTQNYRFEAEAEDSPRFYAKDADIQAVVLITADPANTPGAVTICAGQTVPADLLGYVTTSLNEQVRRDKLAAYDMPQLENIIRDVQSEISVRTVVRSEDGNSTSSNTYVAMGAGFIFTFLIYLFVMTYGAMVMQSVMEEKQNRIVELMVSSVTPFQLMMGKIIGVALVGFAQLLIWAVMLGGILLGVSALTGVNEVINTAATQPGMMTAATMPVSEEAEVVMALLNLPYAELALMFVLYFIGGYLLYASFFAAMGASVNAQEDSSQFTLPVVLVMLFGLYAAMYSVENTNGPLAFWASIFPLTSPIVMMVRIPFGVPWWQEVLSLALLFTTTLLLVWLSGRIYRVGILLYGKKPTLREMLKWVRYK